MDKTLLVKRCRSHLFMNNSVSSIMLITIVLISAIIFIKSGRKKTEGVDTSRIPLLLGITIGMFSGAFVGYFLDKYLLPPHWWYDSDVGRNVELILLGVFFGIVIGGISAVLFFGWKEKIKAKSK